MADEEDSAGGGLRTLAELLEADLEELPGRGQPKKELAAADYPVVERLACLLTQERIAWVFGMSAETFRARLREDAALRTAYKRGRANMQARLAVGVLRKAAAGDLGAATWMLEKLFGWGKDAGETPPLPAQNGKAAADPTNRKEQEEA